jgi:isocitrate lyase
MLAYNLSPSFNWDTTGMSDEQMREFPEELGKMGFVFNFITYGGPPDRRPGRRGVRHRAQQDGMLALARLQRKFRLVDSPVPHAADAGGRPARRRRADGVLGRHGATKAMGKGSTQHQHLVQTEVPTKLLEEWLGLWAKHHHSGPRCAWRCGPHRRRRAPRAQHQPPPAARRRRTSSSAPWRSRGRPHPLHPRPEHRSTWPCARSAS